MESYFFQRKMDFYLEKVIERESGDRAGASRGG